MKLKEQLQKIIDDLEKLERKKDKFMEEYEEKKKKIILKKKDLEEKIRKEKDEKILKAISESFGDINEKNMDVFLELLKKIKKSFPWKWKLLQKNPRQICRCRKRLYRISVRKKLQRAIFILMRMRYESERYNGLIN